MSQAPATNTYIMMQNILNGTSIIGEGSGNDQSDNYSGLQGTLSSSVATIKMTTSFDVPG